jgi:short subunit dehydrogenase-like uncharacterized protein
VKVSVRVRRRYGDGVIINPMAMASNRNLDLIVYGADGLVGRLVCDYIQKNYNELRWAIAGRDNDSLRNIISELQLKESIPVFPIQADDRAGLRAIFGRTKVVLNVAGPFLKVGEGIVEACVESQTHYVDITGEPPFMRKIIDRLHPAA